MAKISYDFSQIVPKDYYDDSLPIEDYSNQIDALVNILQKKLLSIPEAGVINYFINQILRHYDYQTYKLYQDRPFNDIIINALELNKESYPAFSAHIKEPYRTSSACINLNFFKSIAHLAPRLLDTTERWTKFNLILDELKKRLREKLESALDPRQIALNHAIKELEIHAMRIQDKANDKADDIISLADRLRTSSDQFFIELKEKNFSEIEALQHFNCNFTQVLIDAFNNEKLYCHRGSKRIIGNILLCLTGIGLFFAFADVAYGLKNNGKSLLWKTKTELLMQQVQRAEEKVTQAAKTV